MDLTKDITFIVSSAYLLFLVTLIISVLFGVIDSNARIASEYSQLSGYEVAGTLYISNENGEFGSVDKNNLENRINSQCGINMNGFRGGQRLRAGIGDSGCQNVNSGGIVTITRVPVYSSQTGAFHSLTVGDTEAIQNPDNSNSNSGNSGNDDTGLDYVRGGYMVAP